jgi:hypothetical protein
MTFCLDSLFWLCHMGLCHHGMARPWAAVGGDGYQVWRVAANILNKQLWNSLQLGDLARG